MALLHQATLTPGKRELMEAWLPTRSWSPGGESAPVASYRFDDPAGEVGLEAMLLQVGDQLLHLPLTYRGAPLPGAEQHLIGETQHSVLGHRWVYDGCGDPVWLAAVVHAVLTGGTEAELQIEVDGELQSREPSATVLGSGSRTEVPAIGAISAYDDATTTTVRADGLEIVVARVVGTRLEATETLTGQWTGGEGVLVGVRL